MPEKIQNYTVSDRIGTGGTGIVRKGRETETKTDVAVKSLAADLVREPAVRKRAKEVKKALQALPQQENLVRVLDVLESGDTVHVVMEYAPGRSLETLLSKKSRPMPYESAVQLFQQALRGVVTAHSKGVLHGGLKPADVIISGDNNVKVSGFGIAPILSNAALVRAAGRTGKIAYMPPELLRGETIDERTDVYSLGVMLYRMITGKLPFAVNERDSEVRLRQAILQQPAPDITETMPELIIPPHLANLVHRALAKDRRERIPSSREFARLLQKIQPEVQKHLEAETKSDANKTAAASAVAAGGAIAAPSIPAAMQFPPAQTSPLASMQGSPAPSTVSIEGSSTPQDAIPASPPQEKSGLSALFGKSAAPPPPPPNAPPVFSVPTLTKTPMQLEIERRMQAVKAEQERAAMLAAQEQSSPNTFGAAGAGSGDDVTASSATDASKSFSYASQTPSPSELQAQTAKISAPSSAPNKTAEKNDEKKKRSVLPWLVVGAVALGGGIYYIALKNKGSEISAPSASQQELSVEEQERRRDSVARRVEELAQKEVPQESPQTVTPNASGAISNSQPSETQNQGGQNQEEKTLTAPSEKPKIASSDEKPRIPVPAETSSSPTSEKPTAKPQPLKPEAVSKERPAALKQDNSQNNSQNNTRNTAQSTQQIRSVKPAPEKAITEKTSSEKTSSEKSVPKAVESLNPKKSSNQALNTQTPNTQTLNNQVSTSQATKPQTKSGSLAEVNAQSVAEREAARERIRKQYADHLKRKGTTTTSDKSVADKSATDKSTTGKTSALAVNGANTTPKEPRASTKAVVKESSKEAPRTNREDNYAPNSNPVDSPNSVDASAVELEKAARNAKNIQPFLILRGHVGNVRSISFSPDGTLIASGSDDKTVKIWDAATGTILRSLRGHSSSVTSVFFSPDGKTLISSGKDKTVRVWDAATGEAIQRSAGVSCEGTPAAFSPDGKFLATSDKRNINISKAQR